MEFTIALQLFSDDNLLKEKWHLHAPESEPVQYIKHTNLEFDFSSPHSRIQDAKNMCERLKHFHLLLFPFDLVERMYCQLAYNTAFNRKSKCWGTFHYRLPEKLLCVPLLVIKAEIIMFFT